MKKKKQIDWSFSFSSLISILQDQDFD